MEGYTAGTDPNPPGRGGTTSATSAARGSGLADKKKALGKVGQSALKVGAALGKEAMKVAAQQMKTTTTNDKKAMNGPPGSRHADGSDNTEQQTANKEGATDDSSREPNPNSAAAPAAPTSAVVVPQPGFASGNLPRAGETDPAQLVQQQDVIGPVALTPTPPAAQVERPCEDHQVSVPAAVSKTTGEVDTMMNNSSSKAAPNANTMMSSSLPAPTAKNLGKAVGLVAGGAYGAQQVVSSAAATAKDVALVAGVEVGKKAYSNLNEKNQQRVDTAAAKGKSLGQSAASAALDAGLGAYSGFKMSKEQVSLLQSMSADQLYSFLPAGERDLLLHAKKTLKDKKAGIVEDLKATALDMSDNVLEKLLNKIRDRFANTLVDDPAMCECVKRKLVYGFYGLWEDVKEEAKLAIKTSVLKTEKSNIGDDVDLVCCSCTDFWARSRPFSWFRAFVLFHYLPYDKSMFGKFRDPVFVLFFLLTLLPVFAVRGFFFAVVLFFVCCGTPRGQRRPDEYILVQYILGFKGMQFVTGGVLMALYGSMEYYSCVQTRNCEASGPGKNITDGLALSLLEFFFNIFLTWTAFLSLPFSEKHGGSSFQSQRANAAADRRDAEAEEVVQCCFNLESFLPCCRITYNTKRGGRILPLLVYDMYCFLFGVLFVVLLAANRGGDTSLFDTSELGAEVFWGKVVYSLLSFPFIAFTLPGLSRLLTHSIPTGYTKSGYVKPFDLTAQVVVGADANTSSTNGKEGQFFAKNNNIKGLDDGTPIEDVVDVV
ncbi:unnamed protein product [Amoebophrya sp. A120]|nr:unnamed protein product [Amoebophrya sp. A120]|eukprot:GSA120T00021487001.1